MSRSTVLLRPALESDAVVLRELWSDLLRPTTREEQVDDVRGIVAAGLGDPDTRIVVAEIDGEVVGAVHLRVCPVSTLNLDRMVRVFAPHVMPGHQRRGVGSALMDAGVSFAEERGIAFVGAAALSVSRDANRFFARLSLGPRAVLRVASTHGVRQRLSGSRPTRAAASTTRHIDKVLAARRGRKATRIS